jgi:hypothetical protein
MGCRRFEKLARFVHVAAPKLTLKIAAASVTWAIDLHVNSLPIAALISASHDGGARTEGWRRMCSPSRKSGSLEIAVQRSCDVLKLL